MKTVQHHAEVRKVTAAVDVVIKITTATERETEF